MNTRLRILALALAAMGGLTAAPTRATDATRPPVRGALVHTEGERWRLRPTRPPTALPPAHRADRTVPLSTLPDERRTVRIVYSGYFEAGPLLAAAKPQSGEGELRGD